MSRNSLIYLLLFILLQFLLVEINCEVKFPISQRYFHTTTYIDNKLYILGGRYTSDDTIKTLGREFFYLDFSTGFNTNSLTWNTVNNFVPQHHGAATVVGGAQNDTLFLYGGITNYERMSMVYSFNPKKSWMIPTLEGNDGSEVNRKAFLTGIADNGKMYLWGGTEMVTRYYVNDMLILDMIDLTWSTGSLINAPIPRNEYGATLLPNHKIIYMGGSNGQNLGIGLDKVYMYDTINDSWATQVTSGNIPSRRFGFSSNLALDGQRLIIFGGYNVPSKEATYVLDLTNFNWYVPNINGTIPSSRAYHRADVINKYLVVTFGSGYNNSKEDDVLLLDISNNDQYVWTGYYAISDSAPSPIDSKISRNYKLIGIIGASVVGSMVLIAGTYYLHRWNRNRRTKIAVHPPSGKLDNQTGQKVVLTMVNDNGNNDQQTKQ
ncbi:hypothetical protein RhiirC2_742961 [Rhizophagus irregularis]|uniref:Galactose oxidase n=1 Tax=Rhizophagus irregularis TaxID=588596 RepID=A0A2N1NEL8_9GLOM|nr:hypothetical protein RhiirC2_742961 [Rhizophagus irregularis]